MLFNCVNGKCQLKGFRDEKTKNKKQIQDFRRTMGKNRAADTEAPEYTSFRRWQAKGAGPQGHGLNSFCTPDRLSMERLERDWYLFKQHSALAISGVDKSRCFSGTLGTGSERL